MARHAAHCSCLAAALASLAGAAVQGQQLDVEHVTEVVDVFAAYRAPSAYSLRRSVIFLDLGDPLLAGHAWAPIQDLLDRGPDGSTRLLVDEILAGTDALVASIGERADAERGTEPLVVRSRVVSTADVQVEELEEDFALMTVAQRRDQQVQLHCTNARDLGHQLVAQAPGLSPVLYDLTELLKPILISSEALSALRRHDWQELSSVDAGARVLIAAPDPGARRHFRYELDRRSLLPVAAAFRGYADAEGYSDVAVYRHSPAGEGGEVVLADVVAVSVHFGRVVLCRYALGELSHDVQADDLLLDLPLDARLYDERGAAHESYMRGGGDWPSELLARVRFDGIVRVADVPRALQSAEGDSNGSSGASEAPPERAGHDHDHGPDLAAASVAAHSPSALGGVLGWVGLAALIAGGATLLPRARRDEVRP